MTINKFYIYLLLKEIDFIIKLAKLMMIKILFTKIKLYILGIFEKYDF